MNANAYLLQDNLTISEACAEIEARLGGSFTQELLWKMIGEEKLFLSAEIPHDFQGSTSQTRKEASEQCTSETLAYELHNASLKDYSAGVYRVIYWVDGGVKELLIDSETVSILSDLDKTCFRITKQDLDAFMAKVQSPKVVDGGEVENVIESSKPETVGEAALRLAKYFYQLDVQDEKPNNHSLKEYAELVTERLYQEGHRCPQSKHSNRKHNPKSIERLYLNGDKWWQKKNSFIENE